MARYLQLVGCDRSGFAAASHQTFSARPWTASRVGLFLDFPPGSVQDTTRPGKNRGEEKERKKIDTRSEFPRAAKEAAAIARAPEEARARRKAQC